MDAAAEEVDAAAQSGEPSRLSEALRSLDGLWEAHLTRRGKPLWRELGESALAAVIVALLVRAFVVESFQIPTGSMAPTLLVGDRIFVSKLSYAVRFPFTHVRLVELGTPRRGDVIVFENPRDPHKDYVKRVVGVPGDVIELREQVLVVNGIPQPRSALGELVYVERSAEAGAAFSDTCRRYRESLAKGPLDAAGPLPADAEASWQAAAAAASRAYEVLQCRRARLAAQGGAVRGREARARVRARRQPRPLGRQPQRRRLAGARRPRARARHTGLLQPRRRRHLADGRRGRAPRAAFQTDRVTVEPISR